MIFEIESNESILVETLLMENGIKHNMYHNTWQRYFELITESALENVTLINQLEELEDIRKQEIINKISKQLDMDDKNFIYLLYKAEELIEKEIQN